MFSPVPATAWRALLSLPGHDRRSVRGEGPVSWRRRDDFNFSYLNFNISVVILESHELLKAVQTSLCLSSLVLTSADCCSPKWKTQIYLIGWWICDKVPLFIVYIVYFQPAHCFLIDALKGFCVRYSSGVSDDHSASEFCEQCFPALTGFFRCWCLRFDSWIFTLVS